MSFDEMLTNSEDRKKLDTIFLAQPNTSNSNFYENIQQTYMSRMGDEEVTKYKDIGEKVFTDRAMFTMTNPELNSGYILSLFSAIRSGLRVEDLEKDDSEYLRVTLGENWYEYFERYYLKPRS